MAGKLHNVMVQAVKTFNNSSRLESNLVEESKVNKLVALVNELRFTDLNIPSRLISKSDDTSRSIDPVAHLSYLDNENLVIGVFILKHGAKIPLHDHPGMHGLLRVLHGAIQITSYSLKDSPQRNEPTDRFFYPKPLRAVKHSPVTLNDKDMTSVLTPLRNNIHEVMCVSGPAAFLDILSPPYSDDFNEAAERSCHYFTETGKTEDGMVYLKQIPSPDFWTNQDL